MHRAVLIFAALANSFLAHGAEKNRFFPELMVRGEYRRDTLDYDDVEKQFFREKISLFFAKKSSLNLAHIYIGAAKEHRFTWNMAVTDISPYFKCVIGNYHVNFGAGLIAGKKTGISPDLFSKKLVVSRNDLFMPCDSGNPLYSYLGAAAVGSYSFTHVSVALSPFFSYKNRYAGNEIYVSGRTAESFNTILYRSAGDYRHSEPVEINDYGCAAEIRIGDHGMIQSYLIYTTIRRNKQNVLWDYTDRGIQNGAENGFYGYGLFAQYRDGYIIIFFESGISNRIVRFESGKRTTVRDYGIMGGLKFRHPVFYLSVTGKTTGKNFYSPYSSGNGYAENAWIANLSTTPVRLLTLGGGIFAEKKLSPGYRETRLLCNMREKAYILCRLPQKGALKIQFNHLRMEKQPRTERYVQLKPSLSYYILGSILLSLSGKAQKKNGAFWSFSLHSGTGLIFFNCITIILYYSWFFISKNNYLYSMIAPYRESITPESIIKNTSQAVTGKISARYKDAVLSVRYEYRFFNGKSIHHRVELFGKCLL
jgi:hypothetical protein